MPVPHLPGVSTPTLANQRIESLDLIRGFAVCGLVLINSIEFGFGSTELVYPLDFSQADRTLWAVVMGLGCGKFASLFAALFGAGMILFSLRAEASGRSAKSVYLPRLGWLLVFGMIHAYLIWHGDVLVSYAVAGFVLFWCRNWTAKVFSIIGCALLVSFLIPVVLAAIASPLIDFDQLGDDLKNLGEMIREEELEESAAMKGSWVDQLKTRALYTFFIHLLGIPFYMFWIAAMNMCFGIALMKSGFFDGGWSKERLGKMTTLFLVIGLPLTLSGYGVFALAEPAPTPLFWAYAAYFLGMPLVAFGYAGLGVMWSRRGDPGFLRKGLSAVGRMAFTNYISQSLILSLVYYGGGLNLRDQLTFHQAMMMAPAIWIAQMLVSTWWLKRFQHGPLEWLWRRLTYGSIAMQKRQTPPDLPASP